MTNLERFNKLYAACDGLTLTEAKRVFRAIEEMLVDPPPKITVESVQAVCDKHRLSDDAIDDLLDHLQL